MHVAHLDVTAAPLPRCRCLYNNAVSFFGFTREGAGPGAASHEQRTATPSASHLL